MFCTFCGAQLPETGRFCDSCGNPHEERDENSESLTLDEVITQYFHMGHSYPVILDLLSTVHNVHLSLRTLKTKLKNNGLFRRKNFSPLVDVRRAIALELRGPGQLFGYRTMWQVLKQKHNLVVKRSTVMTLLAAMNPEGTQARRRRRFVRRTYHSLGPNYVWHVDGYDKLKPFGFAVSGCIDGFSRRVMWLNCGATNNNPAIIAKNYIQCVRDVGVVPMRLRTDCGTENGTIAAIQSTLRSRHRDYHSGARSHMYGTSTSNQRIESWWSIFRRGRSQFWLDLFADMQSEGHFNGSHAHLCLMRFCFMDVLQDDLNQCTQQWNQHRIRPSRLSRCPGGIPNELYTLPHRFHSRDCGFAVQEHQLHMFEESTEEPVLCGDQEMQDNLEHVLAENNLSKPQTWEEALELYLRIKTISEF